jgi:ATP-dependent Zn protease
MFAMRPGFTVLRTPATGVPTMRVGILALLLVVLGLALLYLYRSQTPSTPQVSISQAVQDISAGRVNAVTFAGNRATLQFRDAPSQIEQTTLAEPDTLLLRAVANYNAANPSRAVALMYQAENQPIGLVGSILLSLVPVLLLGGFFYYVMARARRGL